MPRWRALAVASIALGGILPAMASAAGPVRLTAAFDRGAALGSSSALQLELGIDPRRIPSPVTEVRLLYPKSLGLVSSGLGLAECRRAPSDFVQVIISGPALGGCPPNAVMGVGTADAEVRLSDGQVIPEFAKLTVLAGPIAHGMLGLVIYVDGQRPFGAKLAYAGELGGAAAPFGGALAVLLPAIPAISGLAVVALVQLRLSIGSRAITYYERVGRRTVAYHPDGIALPSRCPRGGFRFRAQLAFQNGSHRSAETVVRCSQLARAGA